MMTAGRSRLSVSVAIIAAFLLGCGPQPGSSTASNNSGTNAAPADVITRPAPPDKATLVGLERNAFDAWKNKDAKFFEDFLADNFTMMTPVGPVDRTAAVKEISEHECDIASYSFADESITPAGIDAAILTLKVTVEGTCGGRKLPSPGWSVSIFVRDIDKWKNAYHNEVAVLDPNAKPATLDNPASSAPGTGLEAKPGDAMTQALLAAENRAWEGWKNRDVTLLEQGVMQDLIYIDARGSGRYKRDEAIKAWTDPRCSVKSFSLSNERSRQISASAALLTYKASAVGSCGGKPVLPVWGSTLYMKEGSFWKALMIVQLPA